MPCHLEGVKTTMAPQLHVGQIIEPGALERPRRQVKSGRTNDIDRRPQAGGHAQAVSPIGQACSLRRVMTTGFVVGVTAASDSELSKTLAQLRPWSLMVVIASSDDYIDDMMTALRA